MSSIPKTFELAMDAAIAKTAGRIIFHMHHGMAKDQAIEYVRENESTFGPAAWAKVLAKV